MSELGGRGGGGVGGRGMEDLCKNGIKKRGGGVEERKRERERKKKKKKREKKQQQKTDSSWEALKVYFREVKICSLCRRCHVFSPSLPFPLLLKQTGFCVGCWHLNAVVG